MAADPTAQTNVTFPGQISGGQFAVGNHNVVITNHGVMVTEGQVPVPRLRTIGVGRAVTYSLVGREQTLEAIAAALGGESSIELCGAEGAGKTALLRHVAAGEACVQVAGRRRGFDDLGLMLYQALWETDTPFLPAPAQLRDYLAQAHGLVILDDLELDRDDLDALLELAPDCHFLLAGCERKLWRGESHQLAGLADADGARLLENLIGRALDESQHAAALALTRAFEGSPQRLVEAGALVRDGAGTLQDLLESAPDTAARFASLSTPQRQILAALAGMSGASVSAEHLGALSGVENAPAELEALERRGLVKTASPRYRLTGIAQARPLPAESLLAHFIAWTHKQTPQAIAEDEEALRAALDIGMHAGLSALVMKLAAAIEAPFALAGHWGAWRATLQQGLDAARRAGDLLGASLFLHELGTLALLREEGPRARELLEQALVLREQGGDEAGAQATRNNLERIGRAGGEGSGESGGSGGGKDRIPPRPRPRLPMWTVGLIALAAGAVGGGAIAASGQGGGSTTTITAPEATTTLTSTVAAGEASTDPSTSTSTTTKTLTKTSTAPESTVTNTTTVTTPAVETVTSTTTELSTTTVTVARGRTPERPPE